MTDGTADDGELMDVQREKRDDVMDQVEAPSDPTFTSITSHSFQDADVSSVTDTATEVSITTSTPVPVAYRKPSPQHGLPNEQSARDSVVEDENGDEDRRRSSSPMCSNEDDDADSSDGRRGRGRRRARGRGNSNAGASGRDRDKGREEQRHHSSASSSSQSPRWDARGEGNTGAIPSGGGAGGRDDPRVEASPRRRGGGEGGSPRPVEELEPSKVLHLRNVGYPVSQADLLSLLSCFGQVEKVKMFSGQALVQLPSITIAKATVRHFEEDEEPRVGNRRIYINYSRSKSIEGRDIGEGGGGNGNGVDSGRSSGSGGRGGGAGGGAGDATGRGPMSQQDSASPYAHLIMEDHAKLLGLATLYLQSYGIPGGEGAVLNINQREEMAEYQRQAMAAAITLNGGANGHGLPGWNGSAAAAAVAATAAATSRLSGTMPSGGYSGFAARARSTSRSQGSELSERSQQNRRPQR